MRVRILVADDHEVVRRGLATLLQSREGWEICGEAKDGREAVAMAMGQTMAAHSAARCGLAMCATMASSSKPSDRPRTMMVGR